MPSYLLNTFAMRFRRTQHTAVRSGLGRCRLAVAVMVCEREDRAVAGPSAAKLIRNVL